MSAGDIRTRRLKANANEAGTQRLTPKRKVEGPILDKRLAVAEIQFDMMRRNSEPLLVLSWGCAGLSALVLVCFVTAPPIIVSIIQRSGWHAPVLWIYAPFVRVMESDFGGPLIWYSSEVWGADAKFFGDVKYGPVHVVFVYILALALCVGVAVFPICRKCWRRTS